MSRSGYREADNEWELIKWRGRVASATRGKRGQGLLKEMLAALDAMPEKRLIAGDLVFQGQPEFLKPEPFEDIIVGADQLVTGMGGVVRIGDVCALGCLGQARGIDMDQLDPHDSETIAGTFNVADPLAKEIVYINDEHGPGAETPEARFERVRGWVEAQIEKCPGCGQVFEESAIAKRLPPPDGSKGRKKRWHLHCHQSAHERTQRKSGENDD